jgi:diguanylate cyclase (GGDEF)-like protein
MTTMSASFGGEKSETSGARSLLAAVTRLADAIRIDGAVDGDAFQEPARQALKAARKAERRIGDQETRIAHLERLARWDPLTSVLNRRGFEDEFERVLASARRHGETGVLVYVDIDDFRKINHIHGHGAGDDILRYVARSLVAGVRDTDYVARVGDDKFAVLLTRTARDDGITRAEALDCALNDTAVPWMDDHLVVRISLGIQIYRVSDRGDEILSRADTAMSRAKRLRHAIRTE